MAETPSFRRHADGSIDFDFYRKQAAALRRQALRNLATSRIAPAGATVMAGGLGFAVLLPTTLAGTRDLLPSFRTR